MNNYILITISKPRDQIIVPKKVLYLVQLYALYIRYDEYDS